MDTEVIIAGAGPTGLVLALWLTKFGIPVRIIDKNHGPGETSRAMAVQARTLEFYQQIGLAAEIISQGIRVEKAVIRANNRIAAAINIKNMGTGLSPFPFVLSFPQDEHEKLLVEHLRKLGVNVQRDTELIGFNQDNHSVTVTLRTNQQIETLKAKYLCACDGARSFVRTTLDIPFPGGTYSELFYVADAQAKGDVALGDFEMCIGKKDFTLVLPVRSSGSYRLIGIATADSKPIENMTFSDVAASVQRNTDLTIEKVNWFSTYHVHHRVADQFRVGRIFLAGDAGHIHSPAGGQGMNTGISDAVNLAWKLAAVIQQRAAENLLATYEAERIIFARELVKTTDKAFQLMTDQGVVGWLWRSFIMPFIIPLIFKFNFARRFFFKVLSQTAIHYPHSALSAGASGKLSGGDRLPWLADGIDNFKPLKSLDWQVHVYGCASQDLKATLTSMKMALHEFTWIEKTAFEKDAFYLIRPDGYIGMVGRQDELDKLKSYLSQFQIKSR